MRLILTNDENYQHLPENPATPEIAAPPVANRREVPRSHWPNGLFRAATTRVIDATPIV